MKVNKIYLRTCIGVEYDLPLIPHFIEYYKSLGVDELYITLSSPSKDHENLELAKLLLQKYEIKPFAIWIGPYQEDRRGNYLNKMVEHLGGNEWVLTADCDEFQEYPTGLHEFVDQLDRNGTTWVQGGAVDRVTATGEIPEKLNPALTLFEQFPAKCNMHRLKREPKNGAFINGEKFMPKVMLHKKSIKLSSGNHIIINKAGRAWSNAAEKKHKHKEVLELGHFKWFGRVYKKIVQIKNDDDALQPTRYDGILLHLKKYGKINFDEVGWRVNGG